MWAELPSLAVQVPRAPFKVVWWLVWAAVFQWVWALGSREGTGWRRQLGKGHRAEDSGKKPHGTLVRLLDWLGIRGKHSPHAGLLGWLLRQFRPFTSRHLQSHPCAGSLRFINTYHFPFRVKGVIIFFLDGSFDQL